MGPAAQRSALPALLDKYRAKTRAAFLFLALATFAPAQWIEKNSGDESSFDGRVVHRHVDLAETQTDNRAMVDLALFSAKSSKLRVIDNADGVSLSDAMRRTNCIAGINGGYFDPNFAPLGLRIIDGKVTSRLTHGRLMSGVLASDNAVHIFRVAEFSLRQNRTPQSNADHSLSILQNRFAVWKRYAPPAGPSPRPVPAIALHWDFVPTPLWPSCENFGNAAGRFQNPARPQSRWRIIERVLVSKK